MVTFTVDSLRCVLLLLPFDYHSCSRCVCVNGCLRFAFVRWMPLILRLFMRLLVCRFIRLRCAVWFGSRLLRVTFPRTVGWLRSCLVWLVCYVLSLFTALRSVGCRHTVCRALAVAYVRLLLDLLRTRWVYRYTFGSTVYCCCTRYRCVLVRCRLRAVLLVYRSVPAFIVPAVVRCLFGTFCSFHR